MASCNGKTESVKDYGENTESIKDYGENKEYLIELEKTVERMTEQQKQKFIIDGEEVLEKLRKEVESDSIDPETRFYDRSSIRLIEEELDIVRKSL